MKKVIISLVVSLLPSVLKWIENKVKNKKTADKRLIAVKEVIDIYTTYKKVAADGVIDKKDQKLLIKDIGDAVIATVEAFGKDTDIKLKK